MMGRLLQAKQVRGWIRGRLPAPKSHSLWQRKISHRFRGDPTDYRTTASDPISTSSEIMKQCFTPCVASVITMSAPQILLSASLLALLLALGMYFGFTWTRHLDVDTGEDGSRNVLIFYIISLTLCFVVYSVSRLIQDDDTRTERMILSEYMNDFVAKYPDVARQWVVHVSVSSNEAGFVGNCAEGAAGEAKVVLPFKAANTA